MYFFLIEVLPRSNEAVGQIIRTPGWVVKIIELLTARTQPRAAAPAPAARGGFGGAPQVCTSTGSIIHFLSYIVIIMPFSSLSYASVKQQGAPAAANLPPQSRYNWGQGRSLGRS